MKCVILAAGYATRLYPLTRNFPKPLLEVGGRTILDHLIDQIRDIPDKGGEPGRQRITDHDPRRWHHIS